MRKSNRLAFVVGTVATMSLALLATVGAVVASGAADAATAAKVEKPVAATVGDFAVQLATALQLQKPTTGFTAESASAALWQVGVKIQPNFKKALTEKDVTSALSEIGYNVRTDDPTSIVSIEKSNAIITTFISSGTLSDRTKGTISVTAAASKDDDFNNGNGKGGKFKRKGGQSPSTGTTD